MKVLFVSSGNSKKFTISPFIKSQADSLVNSGIEIDFFLIKEKGIKGYLKGAKQLRTYLKSNKPDLIHAHYTLAGWSAVLSRPKQPIVLSLMGSDAYGDYIGVNKVKLKSKYLTYLTYLIQPFVSKIICKSEHIKSFVYMRNKAFVIPNGILLNDIILSEKGFKEELGMASATKKVLFLGSKANIRKNYIAVEEAVSLIQDEDIELISPFPIDHDTVLKYMKSVDVLVVPSFMEGSPNVVKEAMACGCPVVASRVGDIEWLFGNEEGYFTTGFQTQEIAHNIKKAINLSDQKRKTAGLERIRNLGLLSEDIASKIINLYKQTTR